MFDAVSRQTPLFGEPPVARQRRDYERDNRPTIEMFPARILFVSLLLLASLVELSAATVGSTSEAPYTQPWSIGKAQNWFSAQPWPMGFNYIPSTAINSTEMWQAHTFDARTIEREMRAAEKVGFHCARIFVEYLVWEDDPNGLKARMQILMGIAARYLLSKDSSSFSSTTNWCRFVDAD